MMPLIPHNAKIDKNTAKSIIDNYKGPLPLMGNILDPSTIERILFHLTGDTKRMKVINEIAENMLMYCNMILHSRSHFKDDFGSKQFTKTNQVISRYQHLVLITAEFK